MDEKFIHILHASQRIRKPHKPLIGKNRGRVPRLVLWPYLWGFEVVNSTTKMKDKLNNNIYTKPRQKIKLVQSCEWQPVTLAVELHKFLNRFFLQTR